LVGKWAPPQLGIGWSDARLGSISAERTAPAKRAAGGRTAPNLGDKARDDCSADSGYLASYPRL